MSLTEFQNLRVERQAGRTTLWLARPQVHNAFDALLIDELRRAFDQLHNDPDTRVVVLAGDGPTFSAGADVNWMRDSVHYTRQQNVEDALRLGMMLDTIAQCSKPVVCRVHGLAMGGGLGLIAAADYAVSASHATFAFSEVKLGIVPGVISPFIVRKIGPGHARALFVTGERFDAERALRIGLVHTVVQEGGLDDEVDRVVAELLTAAPDAISVAKHLVMQTTFKTPRDAMPFTVETIATKRTDPEGQEGLSAFLEKRRPGWMDEQHSPGWMR